MRLKPLAVAVSLACSVSVAKADVLYTSSAFASADNPTVNAWCSSCGEICKRK